MGNLQRLYAFSSEQKMIDYECASRNPVEHSLILPFQTFSNRYHCTGNWLGKITFYLFIQSCYGCYQQKNKLAKVGEQIRAQNILSCNFFSHSNFSKRWSIARAIHGQVILVLFASKFCKLVLFWHANENSLNKLKLSWRLSLKSEEFKAISSSSVGTGLVNMFEDTLNFVGLVKRPTSLVIVPVSKLFCSSMILSWFSFPSSVGIGPLILLLKKLKSRRLVKLPYSLGIDPVIKLPRKTMFLRLIRFPNSVGNVPVKALEYIQRSFSEVSLPSSVGIVPFNFPLWISLLVIKTRLAEVANFSWYSPGQRCVAKIKFLKPWDFP